MIIAGALSRAARTAAPRISGLAIAPRIIAIRTYARPAESKPAIPPVAIFGLDGTYATALYTASAKASALEPVSKALESLANLFKRDPKLTEVLSAPTLTESDKREIVAELVKLIGSVEKASVVRNFLDTLAENNRLGLLLSITDRFAELMSAHRGEIELSITSAQPLDTRTLGRIEAAASKSPPAQGKKLKLVSKVNPEIRGGLIVEIGDRTIDLSLSARVTRMNKLLQDQL